MFLRRFRVALSRAFARFVPPRQRAGRSHQWRPNYGGSVEVLATRTHFVAPLQMQLYPGQRLSLPVSLAGPLLRDGIVRRWTAPMGSRHP